MFKQKNKKVTIKKKQKKNFSIVKGSWDRVVRFFNSLFLKVWLCETTDFWRRQYQFSGLRLFNFGFSLIIFMYYCIERYRVFWICK